VRLTAGELGVNWALTLRADLTGQAVDKKMPVVSGRHLRVSFTIGAARFISAPVVRKVCVIGYRIRPSGDPALVCIFRVCVLIRS